jgi:hypothetical protein
MNSSSTFLNLIYVGVYVNVAKLGSTAGDFLSGKRERGERGRERERDGLG